jgi:hypothetical protein
MTGKYKTIRLLTHIKERCKPKREDLKAAVYDFLAEGIDEEADQLVHYAYEGFKRTSRNGSGKRTHDSHDSY